MRSWIASTSILAALVPLSLGIIISPSCPSQQYTLIPAESRPSSRNCELGGYLSSPQLIQALTTLNQNECITACKNSQESGSKCQSFGYSAGNNTCQLFSKRLIDQQYRMRKTDLGTVYSNMRCYKCKTFICPNSEAVKNGDFSESPGEGESPVKDFFVTYGRDNSGTLTLRPQFSPPRIRFENTEDGAAFAERFGQTIGCMEPLLPYTLSFKMALPADFSPPLKLNIYLDDDKLDEFDVGSDRNINYSKTVILNSTNTSPVLLFTVFGDTGTGIVDFWSPSLLRQADG